MLLFNFASKHLKGQQKKSPIKGLKAYNNTETWCLHRILLFIDNLFKCMHKQSINTCHQINIFLTGDYTVDPAV